MDATRFDLLVRLLGDHATRRHALGWGLAGGLGALGAAFEVAAKKKRKHKKKKKRKKKPCVPDCSGKACGSNGCGGTCGPCEGGECQDGECVCPFGFGCSPNCCATGQVCLGGECQACPVGISPCEGSSFICGITPGGNPCICTTTNGGATACIGGADLLRPVYCAPCATNADCEELLGLPGQAVCIDGGVDCDILCGDVTTGCAVNGCVGVEFCDNDEECSAGTCTNHRCQ